MTICFAIALAMAQAASPSDPRGPAAVVIARPVELMDAQPVDGAYRATLAIDVQLSGPPIAKRVVVAFVGPPGPARGGSLVMAVRRDSERRLWALSGEWQACEP